MNNTCTGARYDILVEAWRSKTTLDARSHYMSLRAWWPYLPRCSRSFAVWYKSV